MLKHILLMLAGIGLLASLGGLAGIAVFSEQEDLTGNLFDSGNVDLTLGTPTALVSFTPNMIPGDTTGAQSLLVTNAGSINFTYTMTTTMVTDTGTPTVLGDELDLTIWQDVAQDGCGAPGVADDSAALYAVDLNGGAIAVPRALATGVNETLCFQVDFPSASTGPESATADATFEFVATQ